MLQTQTAIEPGTSLDGLWVLLVDNEGEIADVEGRVPMMAQAGNDQKYLLGFKTMPSARRFIDAAGVVDAEPRMVVKSNRTEILRTVRAAGAIGVLVDYDPGTQKYTTAAEL
jgi:hypothetical protein